MGPQEILMSETSINNHDTIEESRVRNETYRYKEGKQTLPNGDVYIGTYEG
jgi:hypothetical protein